MTSKGNGASAFEQGQTAGKDREGPRLDNPFPDGSAEHNNFEVGRRFGASHPEHKPRPSDPVLVPDADEGAA